MLKLTKGIWNQTFNLGYEVSVLIFIKCFETIAPSYSEGLRGSSVKDMPSAKGELCPDIPQEKSGRL